MPTLSNEQLCKLAQEGDMVCRGTQKVFLSSFYNSS